MSYASAATISQERPPSDLETIQNMIGDCRSLATSTVEALDRAKGATPMPATSQNKVSAVPNGLVDHIRESIDQLRGMLEYASSRANQLA